MKVPKAASFLLIVLTSLTLLNFILKYYTYFALMVSASKKPTAIEVPDSTTEHEEPDHPVHPHELFVPLLTFIPTISPVISRPWVLITSSFVEEDIFGLAATFAVIFYCHCYLENLWGTRESVKFALIVIQGGNFLLYMWYTLKAWVFGLESTSVPPLVVSGMGLTMGYFVALKQRIPDYYVLLAKGWLRIKVTYIPFILTVLCYVLLIFDHSYYISLIHCYFGFIISWTYLRFFKAGANERHLSLLPLSISRKNSQKRNSPTSITQKQPMSSLQFDNRHMFGDRSEQFSLYTFFPYPVSAVIKFITQLVFAQMVKHKLLNGKDFYDDEDCSKDDKDDFMQSISTQLKSQNQDHHLKSKLFGVSSLKGASGEVSAVSNLQSNLKSAWNWISSKKNNSSIKKIMDKRRKEALKELE